MSINNNGWCKISRRNKKKVQRMSLKYTWNICKPSWKGKVIYQIYICNRSSLLQMQPLFNNNGINDLCWEVSDIFVILTDLNLTFLSYKLVWYLWRSWIDWLRLICVLYSEQIVLKPQFTLFTLVKVACSSLFTVKVHFVNHC